MRMHYRGDGDARDISGISAARVPVVILQLEFIEFDKYLLLICVSRAIPTLTHAFFLP
jgi:hypothetical protein